MGFGKVLRMPPEILEGKEAQISFIPYKRIEHNHGITEISIAELATQCILRITDFERVSPGKGYTPYYRMISVNYIDSSILHLAQNTETNDLSLIQDTNGYTIMEMIEKGDAKYEELQPKVIGVDMAQKAELQVGQVTTPEPEKEDEETQPEPELEPEEENEEPEEAEDEQEDPIDETPFEPEPEPEEEDPEPEKEEEETFDMGKLISDALSFANSETKKPEPEPEKEKPIVDPKIKDDKDYDHYLKRLEKENGGEVPAEKHRVEKDKDTQKKKNRTNKRPVEDNFKKVPGGFNAALFESLTR